jgi:hypothetical protein
MSLDIGTPSDGTQGVGAGAMLPSPLRGRDERSSLLGVGGGGLQPRRLWLTRLPNPPPQGGKEQSDQSRTTEEIAR